MGLAFVMSMAAEKNKKLKRRKNMKKFLAFVLVAVMLMVPFAGAYAAEDTPVWATILQTNTNWNMALSTNAQIVCDEYGWEQITLNSEGDIQKQIDLIQSHQPEGSGFVCSLS